MKDNNRNLGAWVSQYIQNRIRELWDADFLAAFDDASDKEAIKIGFRLYNNVSSTNLEQSKLCVNGPLYIDTRLFGEQTIGCNSA